MKKERKSHLVPRKKRSERYIIKINQSGYKQTMPYTTAQL
jgi:hypothetical protein